MIYKNLKIIFSIQTITRFKKVGNTKLTLALNPRYYMYDLKLATNVKS